MFIAREQALELASLWNAILISKTWGDFKSEVTSSVYQQILDHLAYPPNDGDLFDMYDLPGLADGEWPQSPAQNMLEWIPEDIRHRLGKTVLCQTTGPFLSFLASDELPIKTALEKHGFSCIRDDELARAASGLV